MYHIPGITPEAPTLEAAFGGAATRRARSLRGGRAAPGYETLNSAGDRDVDFVMLGCPHDSVDQVWLAAAACWTGRISPGTELWVMLPRALRTWPTAAATPR